MKNGIKSKEALDSVSIPYKVLKELSSNYKDGKYKKLEEGMDKRETIAVFFERNKFLENICRLIVDRKASGIRFYFGAYPEKDENEEIVILGTHFEATYEKQLTLAFVTTTLIDGKHVDDSKDEKTVVIAGNNGKLCPPDRDCE